MANTITHKQSAVASKVPTTAQLSLGELAINTYDGKIFLKKSVNGSESIVEISSAPEIANWTIALTTSAPNATIPATSFTSFNTAYTNIDAAFVPKGTGSVLAAVPDSTSAGGNKRGTNSVDLQTSRSSATQVASGTASAVVGGTGNTASGNYSFAGGQGCTASGVNSIAFGWNTTASGSYAVCIGANGSTASGQSSISSGYFARATNDWAIALGPSPVADGISSVVIGGFGTARGVTGKTVFGGSMYPLGYQNGLSQVALNALAKQTTDATATTLVSDANAAGTANQVTLPNNSAYYFKGSIIANVTGGGNTKAWTFEGAIKRGASAATTALIGTVTTNVVAADSGASAWTIAVTADTTNGCLKVAVTGQAATTIRWVANVQTTEVTF